MGEEAEIYKKAIGVLQTWTGVDALRDIMEEFPGLDIYLAGGLLRDIVLDRKKTPKDFDFFLGGEDVNSALKQLAVQGNLVRGQFGSPRWFPSVNDKFYCDVIPIDRFFNGMWQCRDIIDVLNQFDFTGNAVAVDLRTGQFYNPQNGLRDLKRRVMRAVRFDYPDEAFSPDQSLTRTAVLYFRILHYAFTLNMTIEEVTLSWLKKNRRLLKQMDAFNKTFFSLHPSALDIIRGNY